MSKAGYFGSLNNGFNIKNILVLENFLKGEVLMKEIIEVIRFLSAFKI